MLRVKGLSEIWSIRGRVKNSEKNRKKRNFFQKSVDKQKNE